MVITICGTTSYGISLSITQDVLLHIWWTEAITITPATARDPKIVLLNEATGALGMETEEVLALFREMTATS